MRDSNIRHHVVQGDEKRDKKILSVVGAMGGVQFFFFSRLIFETSSETTLLIWFRVPEIFSDV